MQFICAVLAYFLSSIVVVSAQETWMNYSHENEITDIAVRGDYVWCATTNGLVRWDKRDMSYRKFTMADGLPHHIVNSIDIAPDGAVWCGTDGGLARFDGISWRVFKTPDGLPCGIVGTVSLGRDGTVWTNSYVYGGYTIKTSCLASYRNNIWTVHKFWMFNTSIQTIAASPDSVVWLGITDGVYRCANGTVEPIYGPSARAILEYPDGMILAGGDAGLAQYKGKAWSVLSIPSGLFTSITSLAQTGDILWAGGVNGLLKYEGANWKKYTIRDGLPDSTITALAVDESGLLWIGTNIGLGWFDGFSFHTCLTKDELVDKRIRSLAFESNGTAWVGTPSGISRYDGKNWSSFAMRDGLPDNGISSITATSDGDVWAGTSRGAARFHDSGWKSYTVADGLADNTVHAVAAGKDNSVWFGTNAGVSRFDGTSWKSYTEADSLFSGYVPFLAVSSNGTVYAAQGEKISRFNGTTWTTFTMDNSILGIRGGPGKTVYYAYWVSSGGNDPAIYTYVYSLADSIKHYCSSANLDGTSFAIGQAGDVWIGAQYNFSGNFTRMGNGGVLRIDGADQTSYTEADGLAYRSVNTIAIAPDGAVWCGTDKGLSRYGKTMITRIESESIRPKIIAVVGNFPNPFNPSTTISFTLPVAGRIDLSVYSITGQKVRTLLIGPMTAGTHSVVWDGRDDSGNTMSSGVYLTHLRAEKAVSSHKILLMK